MPSAEEVRFTSSGTEATLMAVRLARAYTGRDKLLKFDHHFHGWHDAVSGSRAPEAENPGSPGVPAATMSNTISLPQGDLSLVDQRLAEGDVAAVILEPTGASWGTMPLTGDFLAGLRDATRRHNTVLIFDEVVTGFRVAPGGAQERYAVTPDLTTLAKILAGGLPGGAVAGKADIVSMLEYRDDPAWNSVRRIPHPGTFNANPLSAAAGTTMLSLLKGGEHHRHADALNARLVKELNAALERAGVPGCAYGLASYFHITLGEGMTPLAGTIEWPSAGAAAPARMPGRSVMALKRAMLNHGVDLMGGTGGFVSAVHSEDDISRTAEAFTAALQDLRADAYI